MSVTIKEIADQFTCLSEDRSSRFDEMAEAVFEHQRSANPIYRRYCELVAPNLAEEMGITPRRVPFLPVEAFKHGTVATFESEEADIVFKSSATGGGGRSRHFVRDLRIYETSVSAGFEHVFGAGPWRIVGHLPEYAGESSLVYMVRHLMSTFGAPGSGFTLRKADMTEAVENVEVLESAIDASQGDGIRLMLFGAAFGLVDLIKDRSFRLPAEALVVETGGMKTRRREISRTALHARLAHGFGVPRTDVRSEYGMCELMSQCYTRGGETFTPPPWMRCYVVDPSDPTREVPEGRSGVLAVVDLANLHSCSFLLSGDRAVKRPDGFEILGRLTDAELRGCNFLLENA